MKKNTLAVAIVAGLALTAGAFASAAMTPDEIPQQYREAKGKSVLAIRAAGADHAEVLIYGPIGDWFWDGISARAFAEQLREITASQITVRINSDGGVVSDGVAIHNALKAHPATITTVVDGIAASIASLVFMSGDKRQMYPAARLMLHAPLTWAGGNAKFLRKTADDLDVAAEAMETAYVDHVSDKAAVRAMLTDGEDHYLTAARSMELGLATEVIQAKEPSAPDDTTAAAALLSFITAITTAPADASAAIRARIQALCQPSAFASLREVHQRAVLAHIEDPSMKSRLILAMAAAAAATAPAAPDTPPPGAVASAPPAAPPQAPAPADPIAAIATRNESIRTEFAQFREMPGIRDLEVACLSDPRLSIDQARQQLLAKLGAQGAPLNDPSAGPGSIQAGPDEKDKQRDRTVQGMLARAGVLRGEEAERARQGNPAAHATLIDLAEQSLLRAGVQARRMTRDEIARTVLAQQTTSDFPVLLENTLHKIVVGAYRLIPFTWSRFCAIGTLSDYRPHSRYHLSSFSDLKEVNEKGEYENGVLGDGEKESIQGKRKGRILQITPEVLVNDDLGAFTRIAQALGQAAGRTIEKDVYALFALNSGAGPTMSDGKALFHADHNNIAGTAAAPTIASFDAARQLMGRQMDPGGNDYLDILPEIWIGPQSLRGAAVHVNEGEFDDEAQKNQRRPNISRGLVRDIVDTPRLSGNAWYMLAGPSMEPVFEVAFLDGVQTPSLEQEKNFRTDGLAWKVVHKYAVGGVGWRGAVKNAGA